MPHVRPLESVCYRCVETSFASQIVSGEGARLHGGRWNATDSFRMVYLSDTPETALQEYLARARRMKWPDHQSLPMMLAAVEVKAGKVLDPGSPAVAMAVDAFPKTERLHWRSIQSGREAVSQAVGRAAREAVCLFLIAPSQQVSNGRNAALFTDNFGRLPSWFVPLAKPLDLPPATERQATSE